MILGQSLWHSILIGNCNNKIGKETKMTDRFDTHRNLTDEFVKRMEETWKREERLECLLMSAQPIPPRRRLHLVTERWSKN